MEKKKEIREEIIYKSPYSNKARVLDVEIRKGGWWGLCLVVLFGVCVDFLGMSLKE